MIFLQLAPFPTCTFLARHWCVALPSLTVLIESEPYGVTILSIFTTSKFEPLIVFNAFNSSSLQRGSGAPLMYQFEPLSASIKPYFFMARRITCIAGVNPEILNDALSLTFIPIGGRFTLVLVLAQ